MLDDQQLLRRYAADGSEAAFGELVARYVNLVYSVALRRTSGDAHLAQDVAQLVFTDLARKACSLPSGVVMAGWLHRATRYAAAQLLRTERRRVEREQEAVAMNTPESETTPDWEQIRPLLDEALDGLGRNDRDALLLRFFEQRSMAEVGTALGSNEDAARKRVTRALEKLRARLTRRGVTTSALALSTTLPMHAIQAAPAGLAATLTSTSLAGAAVGSGTTLTFLKLMTMTKLKAGIVSAFVVASVMTLFVIQRQAQLKLREENKSLLQQIDQLTRLATENERLSNLVAQARSSQSLPNDQLSELLRLRGVVGVLKRELAEVSKVRAPNAEPPPREKELHPVHTQQMLGRSGSAETALAALLEFANQNQGQLPTSLDQIVPYLNSAAQPGAMRWLRWYEISYQGSLTNLPGDPHDVIVIREKQAFLDAGTWVKFFGFADGRVEWHEEPDDNPDVWKGWENQRFITKKNPGQTDP